MSYTATVTAAATTSVSNSVVPTGGPTCTTCTVTNPVSPTITAVKTVSVNPLVAAAAASSTTSRSRLPTARRQHRC
ncbi:MAG: hypothetical protein IPI14_11975 [Polaromonas sp.]|nr:hypothetical protein [Polaromonas sp.]